MEGRWLVWKKVRVLRRWAFTIPPLKGSELCRAFLLDEHAKGGEGDKRLTINGYVVVKFVGTRHHTEGCSSRVGGVDDLTHGETRHRGDEERRAEAGSRDQRRSVSWSSGLQILFWTKVYIFFILPPWQKGEPPNLVPGPFTTPVCDLCRGLQILFWTKVFTVFFASISTMNHRIYLPTTPSSSWTLSQRLIPRHQNVPPTLRSKRSELSFRTRDSNNQS